MDKYNYAVAYCKARGDHSPKKRAADYMATYELELLSENYGNPFTKYYNRRKKGKTTYLGNLTMPGSSSSSNTFVDVSSNKSSGSTNSKVSTTTINPGEASGSVSLSSLSKSELKALAQKYGGVYQWEYNDRYN